MEEVRPRRVEVPRGTEPTLRVGLLLQEDERKRITVGIASPGYELATGETTVSLSAGGRYVVCCTGQGVEVSDDEGTRVVRSSVPMTFRFRLGEDVAPARGVALSSVPVGRGFHWQSEMEQTVPGSVEVRCHEGTLVLVNEVSFEDYLACVISSEMSPTCPEAFCRAQAVAARSWALVFLGDKHAGAPYDVCNDDDCQRYQGTTFLTTDALEAVRACRGEVLTTHDEAFVCPAYYSKCCGGHGEAAEDAFGFPVAGLGASFDGRGGLVPSISLTTDADFRPWLDLEREEACRAYCAPGSVSARDVRRFLGAVDIPAAYYRWEQVTPAVDILRNARERFGILDIAQLRDVVVGNRGASGRIHRLGLHYRDGRGDDRLWSLVNQYDIRRALHSSFLFSSAVACATERAPTGEVLNLRLRGCGWGHGVGLCQIGALGMALDGNEYRDILQHYYPGARLTRAY